MPTVVAFETLPELFTNLSKKYRNTDKTAFGRKPDPDGDYETIDWSEVTEDVKNLAAYMVEHGIEAGDRVAILSENRYEWVVTDFALQIIGGVNVSIYATLPPGQCEYILQDSEAKLFFVSTGIQLKKAIQIFDNCEHVNRVIAFDTPKVEDYMEEPYVTLYEKVMAEGMKLYPKHEEEINDRIKA
ncbi:MAG: AMP-binding protein, partial [Candidatus Cyclobacteriaceae bacterium M2_1C_046]